MKKWLLFSVALCAFALLMSACVPTYAGSGKHGVPAGTKYHGKVQSVDATAGQITIGGKKVGIHTFTITSSTKIRIDGAKAQASAIEVGSHARIWSLDGTTATAIRIGKHKKTDAASINPQA